MQGLASASQVGSSASAEPLTMDADATREPRTPEDMEKEARWLTGFFDVDE
jgi:hypothetical protein